MNVNKKKLASTLILIFLIIIYLYMCFNDVSFREVDFGVFVTFVINGILSIMFAMSEKKAFTLSKIFYYFNFFFMVIAPMFQFLTKFSLWNHPISNNIYFCSNLLIMLWLLVYKFFYSNFIKSKTINKGNTNYKKVKYTSSAVAILNLLTLICFIFIVSQGSINGLFTRSTNHVSFDSGAAITIVESLCRSIPVYSLIYSWFYCKELKKSKLILLFPLSFTILLNFPASVARYWLGIVYIGIILILFKKNLKNKQFDYFLICLFAILFPIFQLFKWYGIDILKDFGLVLSKFSSTYNDADFDAYSMLARGIEYVHQNGHTYGHQILASLFFLIPRAVWPNKPIPSGQFIAEAQHQFFTNLSFPLIGEGYLDFGIIGIIVFAIVFAKISSKLDFEYWNNNTNSNIINYIYPFSFGIFIFLQRGSMQPVVVYTFAFYLFLIIFYLFFVESRIIKMTKKIREKNVDIARGIAMILVVLGHCDNFNFWSIEKFSSLFFMQLFIFLSGMFFDRNKINNFSDLLKMIKKKCLPIYLYYLKYEIIFYLLTNLFLKIGFYNTNLLYGGKKIVEISLNINFFKNIFRIFILMGREPLCGAFWFLITLIFVVCEYSTINYVINKVYKNDYKKKMLALNVSIILMFVAGCIMSKTINIPRFSPSFTLILFYHLGNEYNLHKKNIKFDNLFCFLCSIILLNILYYFGSVSMNSNQFSNPLYLIICSMAGIYMVMYLSNLIDKKTTSLSAVISYIGQNTLPIVALQFISFKAIMVIQYLLGNITYNELGLLKGANNNNFIYILYVLCGIFIPLLLNIVYNKAKDMGVKKI